MHIEHRLDVDLSDILRCCAENPFLVIRDDDDDYKCEDTMEPYEADESSIPETQIGFIDNNLSLGGTPPNPSGSTGIKRSLNKESQSTSSAAERKLKKQSEKNRRRHRLNRKLKATRKFENEISSMTSITTVGADFRAAPHTQPGFIGLPAKTHPPVPLTQTGDIFLYHSAPDLDPDCDEEVKMLVAKGWTYIQNDLR